MWLFCYFTEFVYIANQTAAGNRDINATNHAVAASNQSMKNDQSDF